MSTSCCITVRNKSILRDEEIKMRNGSPKVKTISVVRVDFNTEFLASNALKYFFIHLDHVRSPLCKILL